MRIVAEEWRAIEGYEGLYEVSDQGRVRSMDRMVPCRWGGTMMRRGVARNGSKAPNGYLRVDLYRDGVVKYHAIHRLVANAFCEVVGSAETVNHKNGLKRDNRAVNLEWTSQSENSRHAIRTGLRVPRSGESVSTKLKTADVIEVRRRLACGDSQQRIANEFGIAQTTVSLISRKETWKETA